MKYNFKRFNKNNSNFSKKTINNEFNFTNNVFMNYIPNYIPKKVYIYENQIRTKEIAPNIFLKGTPMCKTPDINSNNKEIANTEFVIKNITNTSQTLNTEIQNTAQNLDNEIQTTAKKINNEIKTTVKFFNDKITDTVIYVQDKILPDLNKELSGQIQNTINYVQTTNTNLNKVLSNEIQGTINYINFYHLAQQAYTIVEKINIIVEVDTVITLPLKIYTGSVVTIVNRSNSFITINTQNNEMMYNSLYLPPEGDTTIEVANNTTSYFTFIMNNTTSVISWSVNIY
jgi:molecular chaperone GrpE (heat shock protein)